MSFPRYESYKESGVEWLGDVPEHWTISALKQKVKMRYGDALASEIREEGDVEVFGSNGQVGSHCVANTKVPAIVVGRKGSYGKIVWAEKGGFVIDTAYAIDSDTTGLDLRWVYYWLQPLGLDSLSQDTGVPGLAREKAYEMRIVVPPLSEQQTIAAFLDRETAKIDALIAEQQRLIELLKEKRQSVISHAVTKGLNPNAPMKDSGIEWLGDVPEHWEVKRLRFIAQLNPSKSEITELDRETKVSFLPMEAIDDNGSLNLERTRPIGEVETGYTYFREGDVTIAKITPCFENGKGAVMRGLFGGIGFGTTELIVARAKPFEATSNYLHWLFISTWFRKHGEASMYGAGGQKRVPDDFVRNYAIGFPSLEEQHTIVAFLGREISKIDVLTTEAKTAITLLQERRTALISAAVTGKIDVRGLVSAKTEVQAETVPC